MTWSVQQTRRFARQYKKLQDNTATDVDSAVEKVRQSPEIGERKKGDLAALCLQVSQFRPVVLAWLFARCECSADLP